MLVIPERDRDVLYTRRVRHSKSVTNLRRQTRLHLVFKTVLRCPADVNLADKRLEHVFQTSSLPKRIVHWEECTKELKQECANFLGLISYHLIVSKFHNKTHDPKGQENKSLNTFFIC